MIIFDGAIHGDRVDFSLRSGTYPVYREARFCERHGCMTDVEAGSLCCVTE